MHIRLSTKRALTPGEQNALSPGLWPALQAAGADPVVIGRPSRLARIAALWQGGTPILTLGDRIFWPDAAEDFSHPGRAGDMAVLQHELQHVLDFRTGRLGPLRYASNPRNWRYSYAIQPGRTFYDYGAEQRASMAEDLWRLDHGLAAPGVDAQALKRLIPWA